MRLSIAVLATMLLHSCASDHDGRTNPEDVTSVDAGPYDAGVDQLVSVEGEVWDQPVHLEKAIAGIADGYLFVFTKVSSRHMAVALTSSSKDACGAPAQQGVTLYLDIFDNPSSQEAVPTGPGTYEVWAPRVNGGDIPTNPRAIATYAFVGPTGGMLSTAQSGHVALTEVSEMEIRGDFELHFTTGEMSGSFVSPRCAEWSRSASVP